MVIGCSTKKDTFISRNTNAMSTKYNVLFNGNIAFDAAKKQIDDTYEDNFWERLPIEPLKIEEDIIPMPGQSINKNKEPEGFEKAEEKAVKAIQKHSMVIDNFEKNKQIDEAYLLLGKSRYYLQRYIPALESFTFGLENYPNANLYNETRIWKAKTHIRLQNEELAIETLDLVLKNIEISNEEYEKANTAMAMAYTKMDSTHLVIDYLKKSTYYFTDQAQSARNLFILGQIYREQSKIDSSNMVFETLTAMKKIPRKYTIHASLERAKNYTASDSTTVVMYTLLDLIDDRDNREYLDELYYQLGLIAIENNNAEISISYFENSVSYNESKPFQKSLSYEKLGNLYFDKTNFNIAGSYYDSVLQIPINQNTKRIRKIIRKRESLNDVILYEDIVKRNDSILTIVAMTPEDQISYFQKHIEVLKIKEEEEKIKMENATLNAGIGQFDVNNTGGLQNNKASTFYFYNIPLVGSGKQQFKNRFGNRPLTDNWIVSALSSTLNENLNVSSTTTSTINNEQKYDVNYYIDKIPNNKNKLDSIVYQRNDAYYNLGLIYKEQFKEFEMAAVDFELFLKNNPSANLILPTKYHLYKTYANFNTALSNKYRDEIVNDYPESRYAEIIKNPNSILNFGKDEESPEYIYKSAYVCFEENDYDYALSTVNDALKNFKGLEIEAKFELLKAFLLLKTEGEKAFIDKLNFVIINYPNTVESDHAESVIEKMKNKLKK